MGFIDIYCECVNLINLAKSREKLTCCSEKGNETFGYRKTVELIR